MGVNTDAAMNTMQVVTYWIKQQLGQRNTEQDGIRQAVQEEAPPDQVIKKLEQHPDYHCTVADESELRYIHKEDGYELWFNQQNDEYRRETDSTRAEYTHTDEINEYRF